MWVSIVKLLCLKTLLLFFEWDSHELEDLAQELKSGQDHIDLTLTLWIAILIGKTFLNDLTRLPYLMKQRNVDLRVCKVLFNVSIQHIFVVFLEDLDYLNNGLEDEVLDFRALSISHNHEQFV